MISVYIAGDKQVRCWPQVVILSCFLLLLAPLPSDAQDVCVPKSTLQITVEKGTAEIAEAYAETSNQLSLEGKSNAQSACNWTCSNSSELSFLKHVFAFLQYNCHSTKVPNTRLPTGKKTKSQMGLSITDAEYRQETDKIFRSGSIGVGDLMRVPSQLEDASKSGDVKKLTNAVTAIPGATWMKFSSTSVDNDGQGADRVIIRVPDSTTPPRFEQWIQIAIDKDTGKLGRNVDFIAATTDPPMVAFRGFSRTSAGFKLEGDGSNELSKCYSCHPSGLRPIIPAKQGTVAAGGSKAIKPEGTMLTGSDLDSQLENLKLMTSALAVFGPMGYEASENGPPLGPDTWSDRDDLVAKGLPARPDRAKVPACAPANLSVTRRQAIVKNMNCMMCHDGETDRGVLNAGTSLATIRHKVVENEIAPMPPEAVWQDNPSLKLDSNERTILFECLKAEYAERLHIWLTPSP